MKKILFAFSLLAVVYSCQKEIDVDLNEANPQLIIEANYIITSGSIGLSGLSSPPPDVQEESIMPNITIILLKFFFNF